ncbi:UNVERIFIED_CONTAM: hypothetical protein H355_008304 [Colinus virginianus]|nr:hypothetical protein H355_008304 [Colinus virginianus]
MLMSNAQSEGLKNNDSSGPAERFSPGAEPTARQEAVKLGNVTSLFDKANRMADIADLSQRRKRLSCCYHAKDNLMCRDVCEQILSSKSDSRLKHLLQRAPEYCPESMGEVWGCINSSLPGVLKKSDGWVGLGCCELAIAVECRQACKQEVGQYVLKENGRGKLCAPLVFYLSLLPAFYYPVHLYLKRRELCTKLYSTSWGNSQSWQEFDRFCEYNAVEVSMLTCLADVREPCQLGCRNLSYCTNFNNRSDCVEILKKCGDHNKFPEGHSAESICELLSPTDDLENCIPLDTYLTPLVEEVTENVEFTTPHVFYYYGK